jgi:hypothetical protein
MEVMMLKLNEFSHDYVHKICQTWNSGIIIFVIESSWYPLDNQTFLQYFIPYKVDWLTPFVKKIIL